MESSKKDIFVTDIFESVINPPKSSTYSLINVKLPTNQDMYFISKWHEIFDRYCSARIFIREALKDSWDDWKHWFNLSDDEKENTAFKLIFIGNLYETALINYNILVDLSWTITYVSCEYALYKFDQEGNITNLDDCNILGMMPIEKASETLRKAENQVSTPTAENTPFEYLKKRCKKFENAIDIIIDFWNEFSNSKIRNNYNYIKHKGKPIYKELNDLNPRRFFDLKIGKEHYPSDIRDIQKVLVLFDSIHELIDFDDNKLFPYYSNLITELKKAVDPSPMVF